LDDLLNDVRNAEGDFEDVNIEIRDAVERGSSKSVGFPQLLGMPLKPSLCGPRTASESWLLAEGTQHIS
jgi:hypothetical protein